MTVHALLADPPFEGLVLPMASTLSEAQAARLHAAMVKDTMRNVEGTGGELLVNYPPAAAIPDGIGAEQTPEAALRELAAAALDDPDEVRFEVQVGDAFAGRAANTAEHLLEEEGVATVAILDGRAPTLLRTALDSAAMKLRRNEVVIAPAAGGRLAYIGVSEPIDFARGLRPPEVESIATVAADAGYSIDFLPVHPLVSSEAELATLVATVRARRRADRFAPDHTAAVIDELGLHVAETDGRRTVAVE